MELIQSNPTTNSLPEQPTLLGAGHEAMDGRLREKHLAFADFIARFGRSYASKTEVDARFEIFAENYDDIQAHNERYEAGETLFEKGVNKFTDLTRDEFNARYHSAMLGAPAPKKKSGRPHVLS